jgi:energy-converting hydrogenase A subunit J
VLMLLVLLSLSFVCALSPMLSPYDAVTVQVLAIVLILGYVALRGVIG